MKKKVVERPKKKLDIGVYHHKDGTTTYVLPDETERVVPKDYVPAFTCADCGSIDPLVHGKSCRIHMNAAQVKSNVIAYSHTPALWCVELSGHKGEEVRCVSYVDHGDKCEWPTSRAAIELQERLGAVVDAQTRQRRAQPVRVAARSEGGSEQPATTKAASGPRAPRASTTGLAEKTIHVLQKENPRKEGTKLHELYAALKDGETVGSYMERSGAEVGNILKCVAKGWIEVKP